MSSEYFRAQARDVMERAGGDPGNAGPLAAWAEDARLHRDWQRLGVIVAYDGTLIAETVRLNIMVGITAVYVVDLLGTFPRGRQRRRATTPGGGRVDSHGGPQARSGGLPWVPTHPERVSPALAPPSSLR